MRISKLLGMRRQTVADIMKKIRTAMGSREKNLTLAGTIEMDEAFFGGRSKTKDTGKPPTHNKKQALVLVESEGRQAGNLVMKVIESSEYENLKEVLEQKVESDPPGQKIIADGLGSHHVVVALGHTIKMGHIPSELQSKILPCLNLAVSHAKRFFKGTFHHFCKRYIQLYFDEFCYRWNRRHLEKQLASHLLIACVLHQSVKTVRFKSSPTKTAFKAA